MLEKLATYRMYQKTAEFENVRQQPHQKWLAHKNGRLKTQFEL